MKKLDEEIKNGNLARCYVFYGDESYLIKEYENKMKQIFSGGIDECMNVSVFDGAGDINAVIDAAETLPFFAEKRLIVIKDSGLLAKGRKNDSENMSEFIKIIPESACLLFVETKVEKTNSLYKAISKAGRYIEFKTPSESEMVLWVVSYFKNNKCLIDKKTALYLLRNVGGKMENVRSEMDKVISYLPKGSQTKVEDIDRICTKSLETKVFDLVDAIGARETEKAVGIYKNLILAKEEPMNILAMISRQFKIMLQCKALLEVGEVPGNIAARIGESPFAVKKCIAQGKNFTVPTLKKAFEECALTNFSIKNGSIGDRLAVEVLIIKYSN